MLQYSIQPLTLETCRQIMNKVLRKKSQEAWEAAKKAKTGAAKVLRVRWAQQKAADWDNLGHVAAISVGHLPV